VVKDEAGGYLSGQQGEQIFRGCAPHFRCSGLARFATDNFAIAVHLVQFALGILAILACDGNPLDELPAARLDGKSELLHLHPSYGFTLALALFFIPDPDKSDVERNQHLLSPPDLNFYTGTGLFSDLAPLAINNHITVLGICQHPLSPG
jgi:hypothetical protein